MQGEQVAVVAHPFWMEKQGLQVLAVNLVEDLSFQMVQNL